MLKCMQTLDWWIIKIQKMYDGIYNNSYVSLINIQYGIYQHSRSNTTTTPPHYSIPRRKNYDTSMQLCNNRNTYDGKFHIRLNRTDGRSEGLEICPIHILHWNLLVNSPLLSFFNSQQNVSGTVIPMRSFFYSI